MPRRKRSRLDCIIAIQKIVRGFLARCRALREMHAAYEKIRDPATGAFYYYNKCTDVSSWEKPRLLRLLLGADGDFDLAPTYTGMQTEVLLLSPWLYAVALSCS